MSKKQNLSQYGTLPDGSDLHIGIVVSEWNANITNALLEGCRETLTEAKVNGNNIKVIYVPGTFELPQGATLLMQSTKVDVVINIGCVIKGDTNHNEYISTSVATLLNQIAAATKIPQIFGVLTPNTMLQAEERSGGKHGNKGVEAAVTALRMARLKKELTTARSGIGFTKF